MPPKIAEKPAAETKAGSSHQRELEAAISSITKKLRRRQHHAPRRRAGAGPKLTVIPTRRAALDLALGVGGIPRGRVVEIFGPESSGQNHAHAARHRLRAKSRRTRGVRLTPSTRWIRATRKNSA